VLTPDLADEVRHVHQAVGALEFSPCGHLQLHGEPNVGVNIEIWGQQCFVEFMRACNHSFFHKIWKVRTKSERGFR
jgi:hypothetical protein